MSPRVNILRTISVKRFITINKSGNDETFTFMYVLFKICNQRQVVWVVHVWPIADFRAWRQSDMVSLWTRD